MKSIWSHFGRDDGCYYHRILLPARFLAPRLQVHGIHLTLGRELSWKSRHDALIFHGLDAGRNTSALGHFRLNGSQFVWSIDDDYLNVPDWSPAKPSDMERGHWQTALSLADIIHVSTPALVDRVKQHTNTNFDAPIRVLPNLMDADPVLYRRRERGDGTVRILWFGSMTHQGDLALVEDAVAAMCKHYGRAVEFIFWGLCPEQLARDYLHKGVEEIPWVDLRDFHKQLTELSPDIMICPLADIPFNHCKSSIKILEGMLAHAAVIASSVGEYAPDKLGATPDEHLLYANSNAEWANALTTLIESPEIRQEVAAAGQEFAYRNWTWQHAGARIAQWEAAFLEIAGVN